jgi:hypothetical protein
MQQALEALEEINKLSVGENAICLPAEIDAAMDALRAALAEAYENEAWNAYDKATAEPAEPVAWMVYTLDGKSVCVTDNPADFIEWRSLPLYTAPPQRKPLRTVIYACPICAASLERQE